MTPLRDAPPVVEGARFASLVALRPDPDRGREFWFFRCDCGAEKSIRTKDVRRGATVRCGQCHLARASAGLKRCSRCGEDKSLDDFGPNATRHDGKQPYCQGCNNAVARDWRRDNPERSRESARRNAPKGEARKAITREYYQRAPHAHRAHVAVYDAIQRGELVRPPCCSRCPSAERLHAHHDDYSKPLEVIWLCTRCHHARHAELEAAGKDPHAAFKTGGAAA